GEFRRQGIGNRSPDTLPQDLSGQKSHSEFRSVQGAESQIWGKNEPPFFLTFCYSCGQSTVSEWEGMVNRCYGENTTDSQQQRGTDRDGWPVLFPLLGCPGESGGDWAV